MGLNNKTKVAKLKPTHPFLFFLGEKEATSLSRCSPTLSLDPLENKSTVKAAMLSVGSAHAAHFPGQSIN